MKKIQMRCQAKINLSIDVLGKRPDGYHDVEMILMAVDVCDEITLTLRTDQKILLHTAAPLPMGMENLAYRAAKLFFDKSGIQEGVDIHIEKHIPMGAGMAGGSTDAAGVLCGLNELYDAPFTPKELREMGVSMGADVPFCILGGCALAEGIGERLTPLPMPPKMHFVIAKPPVFVSTKWVYDRLDLSERPANLSVPRVAEAIRRGDLRQMISSAGNILESATIPEFPIVGEYKRSMRELGAELSLMSGSGSAVFGMFADREKAERAYQNFSRCTDEVYLV